MVRQLGCAVGNVHYRTGGEPTLLCVCFRKVKSDARPDQPITFTRCRHQALPIEYRDLRSAAINQTGAFQLVGSVGDGRPLDPQHFGNQVLSDLQYVIVTAVTHHEQPTCKPLFEVVRTVARYGH